MTKIVLDEREKFRLHKFLEKGKDLVASLPTYIINLCERIEETSKFDIDRNLLTKRVEYYVENEQDYYDNNVLLFIQDINFDKLRLVLTKSESEDFQTDIKNIIFDECKVSKGPKSFKKFNDFITLFEKDSKLISYNVIEDRFVEFMISNHFNNRLEIYGVSLGENVADMTLRSINEIVLIGYVSKELILNIRGDLI
jgi:hypothetical protein